VWNSIVRRKKRNHLDLNSSDENPVSGNNVCKSQESRRRVGLFPQDGTFTATGGAAVNALISGSESNRCNDLRIMPESLLSAVYEYTKIRILWRTLRRSTATFMRETRADAHFNRKSSFPEEHARSFLLLSASRFFIRRSSLVSLQRYLLLISNVYVSSTSRLLQ
jgi:hypothetical protein